MPASRAPFRSPAVGVEPEKALEAKTEFTSLCIVVIYVSSNSIDKIECVSPRIFHKGYIQSLNNSPKEMPNIEM